VNHPRLDDVGFSPPRPNMLILLLIGKGSASVKARSRDDAMVFPAGLTSLSRTFPHIGHKWILSDRGFRIISPNTEQFCSLGGDVASWFYVACVSDAYLSMRDTDSSYP
jgi:hypothetical protein